MSLRGVTHRIWSLKYSCVRFRRAAAVWVEDRSALSTEEGAESQIDACEFLQNDAHKRRKFCYNLPDNLRLCVRRIVLALVKPGNFAVRAETEWRMRPLGASSFRGSYWASYSLT